jgi:hypothetical protein
MLTAKGEEVDRIVGLELGADDYIPKPFSPREVVLRIRAVLRRREERAGGQGATLQAGGVRLDPEAHRVEVKGKEIVLTATEFKLLERLLERQGRVQTRSRLLADVWGYSEDVDSAHRRHPRPPSAPQARPRSRPHRDGDRRRLPAQDLTVVGDHLVRHDRRVERRQPASEQRWSPLRGVDPPGLGHLLP